MNTQVKELAIESMKRLNIYSNYINSFKAKKQQVCMFLNFGGYYIDEKLKNQVKELENKYKIIIYAITQENTSFGKLTDFLYISEDFLSYNIEDIIEKYNNKFYVHAYVYNSSMEEFSEFGTIGVISFGGGIKRVE